MNNDNEMIFYEILNQIEQSKSNLTISISIILKMVDFLKQSLTEIGIDNDYCNTFIKTIVEKKLNN